ncbi:MAG: hypothetical protein MHMPM18_005046, partial [Marteilia pararefringens]
SVQSFINDLDVDIKFNVEHCSRSLEFLDLDIFIDNNRIKHQLFEKSISCFNRYIEVNSLHPKATLKGTPTGIIKRLLTLTPNFFTASILFYEIFYKRLKRLGYQSQFLINKFWELSANISSNRVSLGEEKPRYLVARYDPSWIRNAKILHSLNELVPNSSRIRIAHSINKSVKGQLLG